MLSLFKISRLAKQIHDVAAAHDFTRRIEPVHGGKLGEIVRDLNAMLAAAEQRDRELRQKLDELTDARDDAQTANQLMRRLKNEIKTRSAERDAALRRAEAANVAKSQFLANMSHEIRTPMHGILGLADVLSRTSLEARQQALVHTMIRSGKSLLTIINDVLDFSKIESGCIDVVLRPFSLRVAVEDVTGVLAPRFEKKGIELIVRIDEALPDLLIGDAGRIKQILTNLIENGFKFTEAGYVLLDINGTAAGDTLNLTIAVQDTGIGIPQEKLESVFEKFNQVDNSSTRRHEGAGLGLAICRMLVTRMDGRIELASAVGRGTTITISLPFAIHEHARVTAATRAIPAVTIKLPEPIQPDDQNVVSIAGAQFQRARILVVEDNIVNQEVAREYLSEMGCLVTIAGDGREGVACFKAEAFDLVFMDFLMPDIDGLQATRMIREFERSVGRATTPVVALTANAFDKDRESCLAAGMDDFLSKPFGYDELELTLKKWLPHRHAGAPVLAAGAYT